ncbi:MAG: hypothetical protein KAT40_03610, partial [Bacteroidales bacterium]|nr:hypothetical protein [Bacteroidales bacterium]
MKTLIYLFSMMFFLSLSFNANAQWNVKERAKQKLEEKLRKSKQKEKEEQETEVTKQDVSDKEISGTAEQPQTPEEQLKAWSNYNFVPGDKVVFEDDLLWEENGEFPSKWDLMRGIAENAMIGNEKVIKFSVDEDIIFPLMETDEDYLPDKFTIEFDAYFNREIDERGSPYEWETKYYIWLWNIKNVDGDYFAVWATADRVDNDLQRITLEYNKVYMFDKYKGQIPVDPSEEKLLSKWRHVAIEFNIRSLKVYLDQHRLLNIPNIKCNPSAFFLGNKSEDAEWIPGAPDVLIKNIRIAEGG